MGLYTDFMERQRPRYTYSSHSQSSRDVYDLEDDDTFYREPARSKQSRYGRSSYAGRHSSQDLYDEPATSHRYSTQRSYIRTAHRPAYKAAYHDDDFGYGYGGDYDSDYMYNVARKRAFRAATGTKAHSGLKRRAYTYHTPAGRRFDYGTDYYHYPSYRSYAEPDHSYYGSRTALAFSSSALHDAADISSASKRQDRRLLNAITNTLYGVELDSVRPSRDISDRAGFRRHLYGNYRRPTFAIEWDADETKPTVRKTSRYRPESLESAQYNRSMNRLQQSKLAKARDDTSDWSLSRFSSQLASPAPPSYSSVIRDHSYSRPAISHKPSTFDEEEYGTSRYSSGYSYSSPYRLEYSSSQRDDDDLGLSPYRSRYSSYAPRTSRQDETGDLDTYSYSSRPTYSSARNLGSPSPYRISYTSRTKEPFDYEDSSLVEASYKSPYDQVRERMKNLHDNYGFRGTDYFRKEPVETSFSASASSSSLKYKPEGYYSVQTKPTISSSEGSVVPYQAKGGSTATSSGGGSSVKTQKTSSYGIQAITSGYGHRPARLHHYNYGYEVPSYETHHYHRSFPADVRKAVVLAVKARPYYGDYHRYHTHRYHSYPAPVVSIPPAITYTRVKV